MIKSAFGWLLFALLLGILLYLPLEMRYATAFLPVFYHSLTIGWLSQLIFGVGYWFLPKYSREKPRGSEKLAWLTFGSINAGMILRAVGEPLVVISGRMYGKWIIFGSIILLSIAGLSFVFNSWKRTEK
jgi:hypothetical protein